MKILKKIAWVFGIIVVIASVKIIGGITSKSIERNYEQNKANEAVREIEETLLEISKNINSQLPVMVDTDTRLDTTMCYGRQMHYKYTMVNYSINELNKESFHNEMQKLISNNQCGNKDMKLMLDVGVEYYYQYFDKDGAHITTVNISKKDCPL